MSEPSIGRVSIVVPVYNEEASLPELILRLETVCAQLAVSCEVILVDDGSRDRSCELITAAAKQSGGLISAVILNRNYGQHNALMAGLSEARGDLIITMDADLQNPPEEIPRLINAANEGNDVVGTVRRDRRDSGFRKFASSIINCAVQRATGVAMHDYGCMLRAYRRPIVDAMLQCPERSTFIPILANMFARHTAEIDVRHAAREHGESKYGLMKLVNLMFDLLTCMSITPLRLMSVFGTIVAGLGFVFAFGLIALRLIYGSSWGVEGVFPLFAILFIFVGAQLVGLGVLGEYIGRIYNDVRSRPRYFVEQIIRADREPAQTNQAAAINLDRRLR